MYFSSPQQNLLVALIWFFLNPENMIILQMLTRPMDNLYNNFSQYVSNPILLYPILPYHIPTYCIAIQTKLSQSVQTGMAVLINYQSSYILLAV